MKTDAKITGACAVLFEENCCKSVGTFGDAKKLFVVPRGKNGKLLYNYNSLSTGRYLAVGLFDWTRRGWNGTLNDLYS